MKKLQHGLTQSICVLCCDCMTLHLNVPASCGSSGTCDDK